LESKRVDLFAKMKATDSLDWAMVPWSASTIYYQRQPALLLLSSQSSPADDPGLLLAASGRVGRGGSRRNLVDAE